MRSTLVKALLALLFYAPAAAFLSSSPSSSLRTAVLRPALEGDDDKWSLKGLERQGARAPRKSNDRASLSVPNGIGISTYAWGDSSRGYMSSYNPADLQGAYNAAVEEELLYFDTSEAWGKEYRGKDISAEQLVGNFASENYDSKPVIATQFDPSLLAAVPPRVGKAAVVKALEDSLERMGLAYLDHYQIANPTRLYPGGRRALYEGLAMCKERRLCGTIGVCNFNAKQVVHAHEGLASFGVVLASNSVGLSALDQTRLEDGTVDACKRLGVTVLAHSPLQGALASGRYTQTNPTGGKTMKVQAGLTSGGGRAGKFTLDELKRAQPLHAALTAVARQVGAREGFKVTPAQVAVNWCVAKGTVPVVGVTNTKDAREAAGCIGWRLRASDMEALDAAAVKCKSVRAGAERPDMSMWKDVRQK